MTVQCFYNFWNEIFRLGSSDDCSVVALALQCGTTKLKDCPKYYTSHQRDM